MDPTSAGLSEGSTLPRPPPEGLRSRLRSCSSPRAQTQTAAVALSKPQATARARQGRAAGSGCVACSELLLHYFINTITYSALVGFDSASLEFRFGTQAVLLKPSGTTGEVCYTACYAILPASLSEPEF